MHGSVLVRLATDFLCASCQREFVSADELSDADVAMWCKRLQFLPATTGDLVSARTAVEAERCRAKLRLSASLCVEAGCADKFKEFGRLLRDECFDSSRCAEYVKPSQRRALEPWYQRTGPDGSRLLPWQRALGITRNVDVADA